MRRKLTRFAAALGAVGAWISLFAATPTAAAPYVAFYVNGSLIDSWTCGDPEFDCSGKERLFGNPNGVDPLFIGSNSLPEGGGNTAWEVKIQAFFDPDPQIIYTFDAFDIGGANSFGFIFEQDIVPVLAPGEVHNDYSGSATDGTIANGVPVVPGAPPAGIPVDGDATPEVSVFTLSKDTGTTYLNAGLDLGPAFTGTAGTSSTHGPFNPPNQAGPPGTGAYDRMRVDVNFGLGGGNDRYTGGGEADILEVPEPLTAALFGMGLLGLGVAGRRRR